MSLSTNNNDDWNLLSSLKRKAKLELRNHVIFSRNKKNGELIPELSPSKDFNKRLCPSTSDDSEKSTDDFFVHPQKATMLPKCTSGSAISPPRLTCHLPSGNTSSFTTFKFSSPAKMTFSTSKMSLSEPQMSFSSTTSLVSSSILHHRNDEAENKENNILAFKRPFPRPRKLILNKTEVICKCAAIKTGSLGSHLGLRRYFNFFYVFLNKCENPPK
jgi:hypothetical protein